MPQPIQIQCSLYEGYEIFQQRQELAAHIVSISALFNHLDFLLGLLLAEILGAKWEPALDMYLALRGAKEDALKAAALKRLEEKDQDALEKLLDNFRNRAGERNTIVHGKWFISDKYPNSLISINTSQYFKMLLKVLSPGVGFRRLDYLHPAGISVPANHPYYLVWNKDDFVDVENRLKDSIEELGKFKTQIRDQNPSPKI